MTSIEPLKLTLTDDGYVFDVEETGRKINEIIEQVNSNTRLIEQMRQDFVNHHHEVAMMPKHLTDYPIITMVDERE